MSHDPHSVRLCTWQLPQAVVVVALQEQVPWAALQYLTGQIIYGGCVTDDNDRVLLSQLCQRCYQPAVLQSGFACTPGTALRPPPADADLPACLEHIQALTVDDSALIFGMHANADTAYQLQVNEHCLRLSSFVSTLRLISHSMALSCCDYSNGFAAQACCKAAEFGWDQSPRYE